MPPKKKTADGAEAAASGGETKFSWTPENDRIVLLLSFGRNIGPADYVKFVTALPAGANFQGVRQRISKLRMEQKKKYEDLGWELTTEATAKAKAPATPKKRKGGDEEGGEETPSKAKNPRAKKTLKFEETVQDDDEEAGDVKSEEGVKEEADEEV
ncbi:uncharacterized protein M421DRAFT_195917 [Didymella exigua CBS 183.55]|uniref:Uncharacterized protein n=1 Tax=Didymella exigua CBS 183.55 TaxID=1150837 RepID=A0A6A5S7B0_9PLEO|nr:uncharacterized protein M421DRAFT_195917 [Didymella exigua CBS 183.55]KAF1933397.1 hypothetical protein M421DRAFT_195917 [Didymella exigua CBS 183.55]